MTGPSTARDETFGTQRIVARSVLFVTVPIGFIVLLAANLLWDIVRQNVSPAALTSWPLRLAVLDTPTSAALLGAAAGLYFARLQWASANRPAIGLAIDDEGGQFDPDSPRWRFWTYNAGPGYAVVKRFAYAIRPYGVDPAAMSTEWLRPAELNHVFERSGLVDGEDYFVRWYAEGAPFSPVPHYSQGSMVAWFRPEALARFAQIDVQMIFLDANGDTHERIFPFMDRLPSVTAKKVASIRRSGSVPSSPVSAGPVDD
ncbi:MAG: hypothetical protein HOU81_19605 [Hamadaea sp.]|uniref:hypothetical protein n=1 Tax=Hamadaea sp. TaxID=2024425 RepID=UPI00184FF7E1|nr:hypothetical protein [Hamadaea sp.]NUR73029.1 hypothetical protein [Hamadaea sp.]NUT22993.1 hypothetical protein [Hamadaea sp.]